ncbi:MAG: WG repeat-containing protein [Ruminiclostridium sp.]|nr:WG repeat-containing protein [Ruminiclostridium sp.]
MKRLRKVLSLLLVGVIAVTSLFCGTVTASAADNTVPLLKTSITSIDSKAKYCSDLGQDLYMLYNDSYCSSVYRIGDTEIKKWRKTGKLSAKKVILDAELEKTSLSPYSYADFSKGNYALFGCFDNKDKSFSYKVAKYDSKANQISVIYTTKNQIGLSPNGYISEYEESKDGSKTTLKIISPKGKVIKKINLDNLNHSGSRGVFFNGSKELGVSEYSLDSNGWIDYKEGTFYLVDQKGNITTLVDGETIWMKSWGSNYIYYLRMPRDEVMVYLPKSKKTIEMNYISFYYDSNGKEYNLTMLGDAFYGNKAIGKYRSYNNGTEDYKYRLIDISKAQSTNDAFLTEPYNSISTFNNGNMFLIKNDNNKYGFVNAKGKELSVFDDAGGFYNNGQYAPVIKNGKIYLVNKKMKRVSSTIKADSESVVYTLGDELFVFSYGKKYYLMTNKS